MARRRSFKQPKQFVVRQVHGDAMAPELVDGQLVICRQTTELHMGDIVLVSKDGQESIQRIVRSQGNVLYKVATNLSELEEGSWLAAKYLVAKVVWPTV